MPYKILAECSELMDNRARYFRLLKSFCLGHRLQDLTKEHRDNLSLALKEENWRDNEKILLILQKASKKMVKNEEKKLNKKI